MIEFYRCSNIYFPAFVELSNVVSSLSEAKKEQWQKLSMVKTYKYILRHSDKPGYVVHPLIYSHPITGQQVQHFVLIFTSVMTLMYNLKQAVIQGNFWQNMVLEIS